jgi:hypothetical protein
MRLRTGYFYQKNLGVQNGNNLLKGGPTLKIPRRRKFVNNGCVFLGTRVPKKRNLESKGGLYAALTFNLQRPNGSRLVLRIK